MAVDIVRQDLFAMSGLYYLSEKFMKIRLLFMFGLSCYMLFGQPVGVGLAAEDGSLCTLKNVHIKNSRFFKDVDFRHLYSHLLNRPITVRDVFTLQDDIAQFYKSSVYFAHLAATYSDPVISTDPCTVSIDAPEVKKVRVQVDGVDAMDDRLGFIDRQTQQLVEKKGLDQVFVNLVHHQPGLTVTDYNSSSLSPDENELFVVVERDRFFASAGISNRVASSFADWKYNATVGIENWLGFFESLSFTYETDQNDGKFGNDLYGVNLNHLLTAAGTRAYWRWYRPEPEFAGVVNGLDVERITDGVNITVDHPISVDGSWDLAVNVGLNWQQTKEVQNGGVQLSSDEVTTFQLGGRGSVSDFWGGWSQLDLQYHNGVVNINNSSPGLVLSPSEHNFQKWTLDLLRDQDWTLSEDNLWLSLKTMGSGQWTADELPASQTFQVGGSTYGRAYDSAEISGDIGFKLLVEAGLTYAAPVSWFDNFNPYTFYDFGLTNNSRSVGDRKKSEYLDSVGIGIRGKQSDYFSFSVELAKPLSQAVGSRGDSGERIFFEAAMEF
jgi:hemolysin activation/secretion protein